LTKNGIQDKERIISLERRRVFMRLGINLIHTADIFLADFRQFIKMCFFIDFFVVERCYLYVFLIVLANINEIGNVNFIELWTVVNG
jgi:hypothetical protein